jgi:glutamate racemase
MIVVDSGLGGISVVRALRAARTGLAMTYIADTAGFPYGNRSAEEIQARAHAMVAGITALHPHAPIILACNTLSTLCLDALRADFNTPFVGTVPAIKPAAQQSCSRRFTLLATPNTAQSRYSADLVAQFAADCVVDRYGAPNLAAMAERILLGETVTDDALRTELAPAFHDDARGRTDVIVLGCTHYPLIAHRLHAVVPWPATFVDSSEAIARRALSLMETPPAQSVAYVTATADIERYLPVFAREGFEEVRALTLS